MWHAAFVNPDLEPWGIHWGNGGFIRIAITEAAFEAIAATLPLGFVGFERVAGAEGERFVLATADISRTSSRPDG